MIALVVAVFGWLIASLITYFLVASLGFTGIALIGLVLWFISGRIGGVRDEPSFALQPARFVKHLGMALTLIGGVGLIWYRLIQ
jgi:hypothetical protein